jgi:D-alanine--poly(phosphoribitol) ligase subunit 1
MRGHATPRTNAVEYVLDSARRFPDRPALWIDGRTYSYAELTAHAQRLADRLTAIDGAVCATLGERSLIAYCAPLACMLAGKIHVPLGTSFPAARMANILDRTRPSILICDENGASQLQDLLTAVDFAIAVLTHEALDADQDAGLDTNRHADLDAGDGRSSSQENVAEDGLPAANACAAADPRSGLVEDDGPIAYLLFTSGSTGVPKGVAVGHPALCAYVEAVRARYPELDEHQRCTQFFEPTFDLSMHDLFVTWAVGACLYCVPRSALLLPTDFVNAHRLTVWFSVPSMAATLQRYRLLNADALPSLTLALFCGEALPRPLAGAWMAAAPNARCENLYGPTEATIACMAHRVREADGATAVVPIGEAFPAMEIAIVREDGTHCDIDEIGELWLGGAQLALGYWRDPAQTTARFVSARFAGLDASRWYRTGDLATIDSGGVAHFRGRADRQVKLRGYRIELQEVEAHLRAICSRPERPVEVAVVPISAHAGEPPSGIAAFVAGADFDTRAALAAMKLRLPAYMVPSEIRVLDALPLNSNGKIDHPALAERLRASERVPRTRRNANEDATKECMR